MNASILKRILQKSRQHVGKLAPSTKCMGKCAVTRWRIGMPRRQVFSCAPVIYSYLQRTYPMESVSAKQMPLILGNALGLSETVPWALLELVCHYLQAGSSWSVYIYVPCAPVDPCWKHKLYINVVATKYKLYYGCKQHESYINTQHTIQLLILLGSC